MPITVYPTKIEAYDDTMKELVFVLEAADECCATLKIESVIAPGESLEEIFQAIRDGLAMMKLDGGE